jgi:hypothetical protein
MLGMTAIGAMPAQASPEMASPNSLWIGTDNVSSRMVLNTDKNGLVLQSVGPVEATGFAIDLTSGIIYFGTSIGAITARNLGTLSPGTTFSATGTEDMT